MLLVDLQRPEEREYGLRIIEEIRAKPELRTFPIVLATAAPEELGPVLPRLASFQIPVLRKPFEIAELNGALTSVLNAGRQHKRSPELGAT